MLPEPIARGVHGRPDLGSASLGTARAASASMCDGSRSPSAAPLVDEVPWRRWLLDVLVDRCREGRFGSLVPLPDPSVCTWAERAGLGRAVEGSLAATIGPTATTRLVTDALVAAGFGPCGGTDRSARGWTASLGDARGSATDDIGWGVLGTVADALVDRVHPSTAVAGSSVDHGATMLVRGGVPAVGAVGDGSGLGDIGAIVVEATRTAVLAYAHHVELQATGVLRSARLVAADHARA